MPTPSRRSGSRSRSARRCWAAIMSMSRVPSIISATSISVRIDLPRPSRSISARCPSASSSVGPDHPDTITSLNNLASLYQAEGRTADALPMVERMMAGGRAQLRVALPVLLDAQTKQLLPADAAFDKALDVIQHGAQSAASSAVNKLAVRLAAGTDRLAELVRRIRTLPAKPTVSTSRSYRRCRSRARRAMRPRAARASPRSRPNARACRRRYRSISRIMPRCPIRCR